MDNSEIDTNNRRAATLKYRDQVNQKLDLILEKLEAGAGSLAPTSVSERAKIQFKSYMLEHFNISWINDDIEEDIYDVLFDLVANLLKLN